MNQFESDWTSLSQSFVQNGWIQDGRIQYGRIQDGCHHQVNEIELVWDRVRVEEECFWGYLREDNKVSESKMAVSESNMAEFKMAAIIKLSQNEWVKFFLVQNGWIHDGRIQDGCHHQVEWEWMSEVLFVQNGWIQDGRFQHSCNHQVESEWTSEVFFLCKMAESKMAEFKMAESSIWVRMNEF